MGAHIAVDAAKESTEGVRVQLGRGYVKGTDGVRFKIAMDTMVKAAKTIDTELIARGHFTADGNIVTDVAKKGTQCTFLNLTKKSLVGVISEKLKEMVALEVLYLNGNALEGMIPGWLGKLVELKFL
jgi:hypothetical protein